MDGIRFLRTHFCFFFVVYLLAKWIEGNKTFITIPLLVRCFYRWLYMVFSNQLYYPTRWSWVIQNVHYDRTMDGHVVGMKHIAWSFTFVHWTFYLCPMSGITGILHRPMSDVLNRAQHRADVGIVTSIVIVRQLCALSPLNKADDFEGRPIVRIYSGLTYWRIKNATRALTTGWALELVLCCLYC